MERLLTLYSEVQSTDVRWLWYPFIAIGKITLLQGDPGDGKSTMMMNLIAELSTGGKTPDGCKIGVPQGLRKLQEEVTELNERLKAQTAKLYEFLAPQLLAQAAVDEGGTKYVAAAQEDCSAADAKLLLNKLLADGRTVAAVVYRSGERINFVLGSGEQTQADCRSLCRKAGELFGGRGGGSQHFAQGGGAYSDDWRQKVLQLQQLLKEQ